MDTKHFELTFYMDSNGFYIFEGLRTNTGIHVELKPLRSIQEWDIEDAVSWAILEVARQIEASRAGEGD